MYSDLPDLTEIWLKTLAWKPTESQQQQLQKLYTEIIIGNRQINLTRITEPSDFWEKHLWDSLAPIINTSLINRSHSLKVIDVGTGAGFPGIPTAIAFPHWSITLLDSTRKKINFIDQLIEKLNLTNSHTLIGRAEEIGKHKPNQSTYNLALIRAVGDVNLCAEYTLPLLKKGGTAILYRGNWSETEENNLQVLLKTIKGKLQEIISFKTPLTDSIRHSIYLKKI